MDGKLTELLNDPGTLKDRRWDNLEWQLPTSEIARCWWLLNKSTAPVDADARPQIKCRSLLLMRLDLSRHRVATTRMLIQERENRVMSNRAEVKVLQEYASIWDRVDGPDLSLLGEPSEELLEAAHIAALQCIDLDAQMVASVETDDSVPPITEALDSRTDAKRVADAEQRLQLTGWDAIHRERFPTTPDVLFRAMSQDADAAIDRERRYDAWQQEQLAQLDLRRAAHREQVDDETDAESEVSEDGELIEQPDIPRPPGACPCAPIDPHCDPDRFSSMGKNLRNLQSVVLQAELVHINYMHIRFDIHYQNEHKRRWKEANENINVKPGRRGSALKNQCKIIRSVLDCHIKEKCEHLVLPNEIKRIFQQPSDERKPMC